MSLYLPRSIRIFPFVLYKLPKEFILKIYYVVFLIFYIIGLMVFLFGIYNKNAYVLRK